VNRIYLVFAVAFLFVPLWSVAQQEAVINFDNEVIEGERRRPDLFLQTEVKNLSLDALIFLRKDMNDFFDVERKRRPIYHVGKPIK
jgi:hypothetical protein